MRGTSSFKCSLCCLMACLIFIPLSFAYADELETEFLDARPSIQLYMAYAEFKMSNYELAHTMWQNIEGAGKAEAIFNIGVLHEYGFSVDKDIEKAIATYIDAAERGSPIAAYRIGLLSLDYPALIPPNVAEHWLTIAALDGDTDAQSLLASLQTKSQSTLSPLVAIKRLIVSGQHTQAIATLTKMSQANPPDFDAMTELAWLYEAGIGVERDLTQAANLFMQAAKAGIPRAQYAISVMYTTGTGLPLNLDKGTYWLNQAAQNGHDRAIKKIKKSD